jgi:UDP-N-acetylmuramoyl-L-alanyl-D-glutamate--2,6-diaminopimelate ligase
LLNWFYDDPAQSLSLVGITGTNGKTSTCHYVAQWLSALGYSVAVMGTVGNGRWGALEEATHTTPDAVSLYRQLAQWRAQGVRVVVMEVSSHAIDQNRVIGLSFAVLALTQVTRDHLDYHGSQAAYAAVKMRLFQQWSATELVLNVDDQLGQTLAYQHPQARTYSMQRQADLQCLSYQPLVHGLQLELAVGGMYWQGVVPLFGRFNIENLLCAMACVLSLGVSAEQLLPLLPATQAVRGRMQQVRQQPVVVVDYAHTPDALEKALQALRAHAQQGCLWLVFGAGGNRDVGKRPLMGAVAEQLADFVLLTDDNPRYELPEQIAADIQAGMTKVVPYVADRQQAICRAIRAAAREDVVLIAGKGHEAYQEIAGVRYAFSDEQAVAAC